MQPQDFLILSILLVQPNAISGEGASVKTTTEPLTLNASTVSNGSVNLIAPLVENKGVLGCSWPPDYAKRVEFCVDQAGLNISGHAVKSDMVLYGILNRKIVDQMIENCLRNNKCPGEYDFGLLKAFLKFWYENVKPIDSFRACLQKNTEGMVKLCGPHTEVGKVMSGSAGLHLNLLNVMKKLGEQLHENDTESACLLKISEAMHMTAAVYLHTSAYRDNSVMCWNVVKDVCNENCSKFASEMNCVHTVCQNVSYQFFRQFGIWEWYFVGPDMVKKNCHVQEGICGLPDEVHLYAKEDTFVDKIRRKYQEISNQVEHVLHMPLHIVLAVFFSSFAIFVVLVTVCCMWYHGMICSEEKRRLRYSQLLDPNDKRNTDQMKALAGGDDEDEYE